MNRSASSRYGAHDADQVLGHLRERRGKVRFHRYKVPLDLPPAMGRPDPMLEVAKVLGLTIFILFCWVAVFVYVAIAGASQ